MPVIFAKSALSSAVHGPPPGWLVPCPESPPLFELLPLLELEFPLEGSTRGLRVLSESGMFSTTGLLFDAVLPLAGFRFEADLPVSSESGISSTTGLCDEPCFEAPPLFASVDFGFLRCRPLSRLCVSS